MFKYSFIDTSSFLIPPEVPNSGLPQHIGQSAHALLGEILELDSKGLAALCLVGRAHGGLPAQCVVGVLHPLPVEVGGGGRGVPQSVIGRGGAVAVGIADLRHEAVVEVIVGVGVEHTLVVVVLRLGHTGDVAVAVVGHVVDGRLVAVVERNLRDLAVAVHLRTALTVGPAAAADGDMAWDADDVLVRQLVVVDYVFMTYHVNYNVLFDLFIA